MPPGLVRSGLGLDAEPIFLVATFGLVIVRFALGYFVMLQYDLFEVVPYWEEVHAAVEPPKKLSAKTSVYFEHLLDVFRDEQVFANLELTLQDLADRLGISAEYLSQVIKAHERATFFEFVNRYRVEAVKQKLVSADYRHYTIMDVALESGFKSKSIQHGVQEVHGPDALGLQARPPCRAEHSRFRSSSLDSGRPSILKTSDDPQF